MLNWLRKHKVLAKIILLVVIFGIPLIIHCMFKVRLSAKYDFFVAEWNAGDMLQYYGAILAFLGTVILGILSLHQNEIIKQEADKRIELQERREREANMPKFRVKHQYSGGNYKGMKVALENISDNVANEIIIMGIYMENQGEVIWKNQNALEYEVLKANSVIDVELRTPEIKREWNNLIFEIRCLDKYGDEHWYYCRGRKINEGSIYFRVEEEKKTL